MKNANYIVIDASIAHSSGDWNATFPLSKYCRDFLEAVRATDMYAVLSPEIREEWDNHQSRFAREWRYSMISKRKLKIFQSSLVDETLRDRIKKGTSDEHICSIMLKDCRLIEAALVTDKSIASLDDKVRHHFSNICNQIREIREIVWVNPGKQEELSLEWISGGAKNEIERQLQSYSSEKR